MTEQEIKTYQSIIGDYWKLIKKYMTAPKTDAFWTEVVSETGKLIEKHKHRFSISLCYCVLEEFDYVAKLNDMSDTKIYYNVLLDCGNSIKFADSYMPFCNVLKGKLGKYDGNRFATSVFDMMQGEIARVITEKEGDKQK